MSLEETRAFFDRYRAAFNALDGDAVADLWHRPSGIADRYQLARTPSGVRVLTYTAYEEDIAEMNPHAAA